MNISVKEFRQMIEEHAAEQRQWQDDFNLMADEKEAEIKRLELKLDETKDAFRGFMEHCVGVIKTSTPDAHMNDALDSVVREYNNLLDGLEGY